MDKQQNNIQEAVKSKMSIFIKRAGRFFSSAKLISLVVFAAIVFIFRETILEFSVHLIILLLVFILCFLLYLAFRLFILVSPSLSHIIRLDLIRLGLFNKLEIVGKFNKALLIEERFTFCSKELDLVEENIRKGIASGDDANLKKCNEIHKRRTEIEDKINENVKTIKNLLRDLGDVETELKKIPVHEKKKTLKHFFEKSFTIFFIIIALLSIPIVIYLIYFLLRSIKIFP